MFDTSLIDTQCPNCGHINHEGQTKDVVNGLKVFKIGEGISKQYKYIVCCHRCDKCKEFYDFKQFITDDGILTSDYEVME